MSTPNSNSVEAFTIQFSGHNLIDSMLEGGRWGSTPAVAMTYSFATSSSVWASPFYSTANEPFRTGVQALDPTEQGNARIAMAAWSHYTDLSFTEVVESRSVVGDIRFALTRSGDQDEQAHAYAPNASPSGGDVWLSTNADQEGLVPGTFGYTALLHEIGHALGLKHPFETVPGNDAVLPADLDSLNYTVMSYDLYPGVSASTHSLSYYPTTPMALDILAIRALYGKASVNAGDTTYNFEQGANYFQTIVDTGGNDTIRWNGTTEAASIDLDPASWSDLGNSLVTTDSTGSVTDVDAMNVFLYFDTVIENAIGGAADDWLSGNDGNNVLNGMAGHDYLYGWEGSDTLVGGEGNDHIYGRYSLGGADGADSLSGGAGSDVLQGNAGNDIIDGGDGSDRILGGANDDNIRGGAGNDTVNGNLGNDLVDGGDGNDSLRGGQGNDSLLGGAGNDLLSGDLGADVLTGGAGADLFSIGAGSSLTASPDQITDFLDGTDHIAIGFAPFVLTGNSSSAATAATAAQQMIDAHAGNGELAALQVGRDTYLFYSGTGGTTVDSAVIVLGVNAVSIGSTDFI